MQVSFHDLDGDLAQTAASAGRVERLGFDGYAARELNYDPMLQLAVAAGATSRVELMARVVVAYPRSPMVVAHQAWALQDYSAGRLNLGLASSVKPVIEGRYSATWIQPFPGMRDYLTAVRAIWGAWAEGRLPEYEGTHYKFRVNDELFRPPTHDFGSPKISLGATGPLMCKLAGEIADALALPILNSRRFILESAQPHKSEGARKAGRNPDDVAITATAIIYGARDAASLAEAKQAARKEVAFFLSYSDAYRLVTELHGWKDKHEYLRQRAEGGAKPEELMDEIDDDMLDAFAIVALADEVGARMRERYVGALDGIVFSLRPVGLKPDEIDAVLGSIVLELQGA